MQNKDLQKSIFYFKYGKRIFDIIMSLTGLIILSPLFVVIALSIKLFDKSSVFYKQDRVGQNFEHFQLIKFRTMKVSGSNSGPLITTSNDERITKIGKVLRKFKLDEMPQIFNVLKGELSVVGSRPEVEKFVNLFKEDYKEILKVKPGMASEAVIVFRDEERILTQFNDLEEAYIKEVLPKKISIDKDYVRNISFLRDCRIFLLTFLRVIYFRR
jgi:lipopolysaccharide/colanic/teichoic acid biosynthesis glycosyltransferase